jgi:hypothetical protein
MPENYDPAVSRPLNVTLRAGSPVYHAYNARADVSVPAPEPEELAAGFRPRKSLNLRYFGGKTISDLVFVNHYLGGSAAWDAADIASIDAALSKAMSDSDLQSVIQQYYQGPISSRMLPSAVLPDAAPATIYKNQVEDLAARICAGGGLGDADPASTVINIMLPRGVVLVDGFSPGFQAPADAEEEHERRERSIIKIDDDEDSDSQHGLGGYHGSVHVSADGTSHVSIAAGDTTVYYAVGVYSDGDNGIPVFDQPWKNVVATFYHELNEARTDPDVEDVIRTNDTSKLGWYSRRGGEIGDIPMAEAGAHLELVMKEVKLADGSGTVPVQLQWSNEDGGPAGRAG